MDNAVALWYNMSNIDRSPTILNISEVTLMNFQFTGKHVMQRSFEAPSFKAYVEASMEKLHQPLTVPPYCTAGEARRIGSISEKLVKNPFAGRSVYLETVEQLGSSTPVDYGKYPTLYEICMHARQVLGSPLPVLYVIDGVANPSLCYQALACDYMDNFSLYVSSRFMDEPDMSTQAELCFVVAHELGHTQCHHVTMNLLAEEKGGSNDEYSADRAGMLVAASWLRSKHPDWPLAQIAREVVYSAGTILHKLEIGFYAVRKNKTADWSAYDSAARRAELDVFINDPGQLKPYTGTHPSDEHRVVALHHFANSEMFYRLMGEEPIPGLYSDKLLEQRMDCHIQS